MSSSTITAKPYLAESWIQHHMQRHDHFSNSDKENKYARSTASSRSRCSATSSMISEDLANGRRRKSTAASVVSEQASKIPSSTAASTTNLVRLQQLQSRRRQTLSGALTGTGSNHSTNKSDKQLTTASAITESDSNANRGPGLIKLADTLRETLALERKLAKEELEKANKTKTTNNASFASTYTRRRTLSTNNVTRPSNNNNNNSQNSGTSNYMKATLADQQRRNSFRTSPPSQVSAPTATRRKSLAHLNSGANMAGKEDENDASRSMALRRRSILAAATVKARQQQLLSATSPSSPAPTATADMYSSSHSAEKAQTPTATSSSKISPLRRTRKKSVLSEVNAERRMSRTESLKEGIPTNNTANNTATISPLRSARLSRRKSSIASSPTKRNSSITTLKETGNNNNNVTDGDTTAAGVKTTTIAAEQKQKAQKTAAVVVSGRKRGKTLPGNLAKPPTVQSLKLPPMKVEPIKLNIQPARKRTSILIKAKTPIATSRIATQQKKRMSLSENTTPVPACSSSSSASSSPITNAAANSTPTSMATKAKRKSKGLSLIDTRRASLRNASSLNHTPPHTATLIPVSNTKPSPRARPTSTTRRQSLGLTLENQSRLKRTEPFQQKDPYSSAFIGSNNSAAYYNSSNGSRKNSFMAVDEFGAVENNATGNKFRRSTATAVSLREKLEAMVAEHAINEDTLNNHRSPYLAAAAAAAAAAGPRKRSKDLTSIISDGSTLNGTAALLKIPPHNGNNSMNDIYSAAMATPVNGGTNIPMSPTIAIKLFGHQLSPYEQAEIQGYPEIYFLGHSSIKKNQAMPDHHHHHNNKHNYGYDDEKGDYKILLHDHLAYRYEVLEELGRGSFGQVVKCFDHKLGITVAIKLIRNKKRFYAQAKTEVKILSDLIKWDPEDRHHNVKMTEYFNFRNHLCIACECLSMNLYEFIKLNNFQGFQTKLIKRFTIQILRSLSLLERHGVIHCDLKPENILLKHPTKSTIKVIDFGSSCLTHQRVYTYIQSRFYRSPEIILGLDYGTAIDMWSLGCIIAELYTGVPLFPGENEQEQLACIMEVLGVPDAKYINMSERKSLFFDRHGEPRAVFNSHGKKRKAGSKSLPQVLRCNDPLFLDFIQQCLEWDPLKRMTPDTAFQHAWIVQQQQPQQQQLSLPPSSSSRYSPSSPSLLNQVHQAASARTSSTGHTASVSAAGERSL